MGPVEEIQNLYLNNTNGCLDENACNFDSSATIDNGTCEYPEVGINCDGQQLTYVPDDNFEQALIYLGYDDILDDYVLTSNISNITNLDL